MMGVAGDNPPSGWLAGPTVVGNVKWGSPPYMKKVSVAHIATYIEHGQRVDRLIDR